MFLKAMKRRYNMLEYESQIKKARNEGAYFYLLMGRKLELFYLMKVFYRIDSKMELVNYNGLPIYGFRL